MSRRKSAAMASAPAKSEVRQLPRQAPAGTTKIVFKHEGHERGHAVGPLWFVDAAGKFSNVLDSDMEKWDGKMFPEWFKLGKAEQYAKALGLPLEEV